MARESLCALQHFDLHRRHFSLLFSVFFMNDLAAGGDGGGGGEGGGGSDEKKDDKGKDAKKDAKKEEKKDAAPAEGAGGAGGAGGGTLASYMDLLGARKNAGDPSLVAATLCGNVEMVLRSKFSLTGGVAIANSIVQEVRASGHIRPPFSLLRPFLLSVVSFRSSPCPHLIDRCLHCVTLVPLNGVIRWPKNPARRVSST